MQGGASRARGMVPNEGMDCVSPMNVSSGFESVFKGRCVMFSKYCPFLSLIRTISVCRFARRYPGANQMSSKVTGLERICNLPILSDFVKISQGYEVAYMYGVLKV